MSVRHSSSTPHHSQSLPSFAQAFSNSSLDRISAHNNALPPIQPHTAPMQRSTPQQDTPPPGESSSHLGIENGLSRHNGRKRSHPEMASNIRGEETSDSLHRSPRLVLVKEEQDELIDDRPSPPRQPRPHLAGVVEGNSSGPTPQQPVSKKRRVTVSGHTQSIDTGVSPSVADPNNAAPLSPVVMGFNMRDDPAAIEQMRSVLTIKQSQKALIEQRRGSVGGPPPSIAQGGQGNTHTPPVNVPTAPHPNRPSAPATRTGVRSPSMGGGRVRASISGPELPLSPNAPHATSQQQPPPEASSHTQTSGGHFPNALPPPPISFARRRAGAAGKKKPADIVISPRDPQTNTRLQPVIQSAPAIAHGPPGRFPMALPSLPPVLGQGQPVRRAAPGNVPPTPTRLSMRGAIAAGSTTSAGTGAAPTPGGGPTSGRSPPASVPIAATLVPPTPASLQHPGYSSDKASFLAPFEVFYDALRDAKELKAWLGEQLQKSQSLQASLVQQHEKLEQVVEAAVERRVGAMRDEIGGLRRRIGELEDALHAVGVGSSGQPRRHSLAVVDTTKGRSMGSGSIVSPTTSSSVVPDTYTFPPVEPPGAPRPESGRLLLSPTQREKDVDVRSNGDSQNDSPVPYDINRRLSVSAVTSAVRMDPPPAPAQQPDSSGPALRSREHPPPPSSTKGKGTGSPRHSHFAAEHSATHRRASTNPNEDAEHGAGRHPSRSIPGEQKRDTVYTSPRSLPASPMDDS